MSYLARAKKCDLISLCEELGIDISPNAKVAGLIKLIKESEDFDEDFVKCRLEIIQEEREREIEAAKEAENKRIEIEEKQREIEAAKEAEMKRVEIEEKQKEREFELRRLEIASRTRNPNREDNSEAENIRVKHSPQNIIPRFDGAGDISIYLALFEKQMPRLNVPKENWVMYLLGLLPLEFVNIVSRESDHVSNDYDYVKNLLLKRFKLTTEEFRQKFLSHRKQHSANWRDFAFELHNYFDEWLRGMNVDNFENLKELIVTDRIKQTLPYEIQEHFMDELPNIKKVDELVNKLDDYEAVRRSFKKEANRSVNSSEKFNRKPELRDLSCQHSSTIGRNQCNVGRNIGKYPSRFQNDDKSYQTEEKFRDKSRIQCFNCGGYGHVRSQCANMRIENQVFRQGYRSNGNFNRMANSHANKEVNVSNASSSSFVEKEIQINGKKTKCLFDTGSELNLTNDAIYQKIGSPELSTDEVRLYGIANEVVRPLGYFSAELCIDGIDIKANIYVVRDLGNEVILGRDVISQLDLIIDKEGLKILNKREKAWIGIVNVVKKAPLIINYTPRSYGIRHQEKFEMKRSPQQPYFHNKNIANKKSTVKIPEMNEDNITLVKEINGNNVDVNKVQIGIQRFSGNKNLTREEITKLVESRIKSMDEMNNRILEITNKHSREIENLTRQLADEQEKRQELYHKENDLNIKLKEYAYKLEITMAEFENKLSKKDEAHEEKMEKLQKNMKKENDDLRKQVKELNKRVRNLEEHIESVKAIKKTEEIKTKDEIPSSVDSTDIDVSTTDKEAKIFSPEKQEVKSVYTVKSYDLTAISEYSDLTKLESNEFINVEQQMMCKGTEEEQNEDARDDLEEFVYHSKRKLREEYREFVLEEDRNELLQNLNEIEEWLEENVDLEAAEYLKQLRDLRSLCNPIFAKCSDLQQGQFVIDD